MTKAQSERPDSAATLDDSSLAIGHSSLIRHSGFVICHSRDARVVAIAVLLFAAVSLTLNVLSRGFLEADGITHYLFARFSFEDPQLFTNVWGRPFVTAIHALPAQLPGTLGQQPIALIGVRSVSMLLAIAAAVVAWRVAISASVDHRTSGQPAGAPADTGATAVAVRPSAHSHTALAAVFMLCMPMVILHSVSELTELPFGFLAVAALWAYQRRAWPALALLAGLLPAARPEGFGLAALAMAGLLLHRRWLEAAVVVVPLVAWDRLGWALHENARGEWWQIFTWLADNWPYAGESLYAPGPIWKLAWMLPAVVGPVIVPFILAGIIASLREDPREHRGRVAWLIAGVPLAVLLVHSVLHWLGKMGSSGDVRYLVSVAPFWALLAWRGWDSLSTRLHWRGDYLWAAAAGAVPLIAMHAHYPIVPYRADAAAREVVEVARWYRQSEFSRTHPRLATDHPLMWYTLDVSMRDNGGGKQRIVAAEPGTLFLWHEVYSMYNAGERFVVPPEFAIAHGWREATPEDFASSWRVFVTVPAAAEPK